MPTYGAYCVTDGFDQLQSAVAARTRAMIASGDKAGAELILDAYVKLRSELDLLATRMSVRGTRLLREHEKYSRVRPDSGGLGGKRLGDYLLVEPIKVFGVHGTIGIANYDVLDQEVPWWWTQETGYAGNVGRLIFGAFFHPGGDTRPSRALDRQHAIFEPRGDAVSRAEGGEGGKRGSMEIRKPIGAKHFLEQGARVIETEWLAGFAAIEGAFIAEIVAVP